VTLYRYRAADARGRIVRGESRADTELELEKRLARVGLELLAATEPKVSALHVLRRRRLSPNDLINFFIQLESLLRAGVPLLECLQDLRDSAASQVARLVAANILDRVETGSSLSDAMAAETAIFNPLLVGLVRTGEVTGKLPDVLAEIVASLKWQLELSSRTRKALRYPLFVSVVILAVIAFLMVYLVPQLSNFLTGMGRELPLQTRALMAVSGAVVHWWPVILAVPAAAVLAFRVAVWRSRVFRLRVDGLLLRLPLVGDVLRKVCLARFCNAFALMFGAGIPVLDTLQHCQESAGNLAVGDSIGRARELVGQGTSVSEAFAMLDAFPSYVVRMVKVGELTGQLDVSLRNVSYFFMRDVNEQLERLQSMIEPVLTLIMGVVLGWVMLAVLGPVYDSISLVRS
jgi:type IV pilus assembly protein PilC